QTECQGGDCAAQSTFGEHWRVNAADEVSQLDERRATGFTRFGEQLVGLGRVPVDEFVGQADDHAQRGEAGLDAVVQVAFDAAQFGRLGVHRVGACDR